ncbi:unnamed protein product [Linum tenue]|uniref:ACT domain-containing protein n=1 Tax=Linum tenue TaxID=586396 RepID=A0AAV0JZZ0_9ROSI|nr:unnamed protein product [Linum tenue]
MASRESKKSSLLHENLQLLRSITNSTAVNRSSIIVDASNYIQQLKQKIEKLNHDIQSADHHHHRHQPSSSHRNNNNNINHTGQQLPVVTVETLEKKGFLINIFSGKNCPGLLVSVLEAFEDLGLNVVEARASCSDSFRLQAVGSGGGDDQNEEEEEEGEQQTIDPQVIKQAVLQAINDWDG